jgi:hypothetical protein
MRRIVVLVATLTTFLLVGAAAQADPQPATVAHDCTVVGASIPPGPPAKVGAITVTPSPNSGQGVVATATVPGPCGAPGFNK